MNELRQAMYNAASAVRQSFSKDKPLVLHEPFHGLGGARMVAEICNISIRLGNLSCDTDMHFAGYYAALAQQMSHPPVCGKSIMDIPMEEIDDAHGTFYILSSPPLYICEMVNKL